MNITITITDASPEDLDTITSFVQQMQSRGVAVEAPQEQAQEPQEDYLQKVKDSNITCEYDAQMWSNYATRTLMGQDLQDALTSINAKLEANKQNIQSKQSRKTKQESLRAKYRAIYAEMNLIPDRVHNMLKLVIGSSSNDWSVETLERVIALLEAGVTDLVMDSFRGFCQVAAMPQNIEKKARVFIKEEMQNGNFEPNPWMMQLLCCYIDSFSINRKLKALAEKYEYPEFALQQAWGHAYDRQHKHDINFGFFVRSFEDSNSDIDNASVKAFYHETRKMLIGGCDRDTMRKRLKDQVRAAYIFSGTKTACSYVFENRKLQDEFKNEKSQPS